MNPRTDSGPHIVWPHCAVGMQRADASATGLPSMSPRARSMLSLRIPPDVSNSFMEPPEVDAARVRRCPRP